MSKTREPGVGPLKKVSVRISHELRERLGVKAKQNHRSLNAEIVLRIAIGLDATDHFQRDSSNVLDRTDSNSREETILAAFRLLESGKQQALLSLLFEMAGNNKGH
ncbi:Arc family DNA-binding protein [Pseudomonas syringae group genomosp. 3]|uniref:Arc family DNA-binding protein n=1 Tax=Pseudomonas syringae group genomosp. 3 TaxID=251701 RepID=UPI000F3C73C5|nr:Arc family DNA-binding protein [Pseudomonas syringae group genomosp. 3]RMP68461.1 hypothetical protein ALQ19_200211 [Pseudomonas syringae pv. berberidis]